MNRQQVIDLMKARGYHSVKTAAGYISPDEFDPYGLSQHGDTWQGDTIAHNAVEDRAGGEVLPEHIVALGIWTFHKREPR